MSSRPPRETLRSAIDTGRSVVTVVQDEQVSFLAAAIAYYAFVSLLPLLALTAVIAAAIGGPDLVERIVDEFAVALTPAVRTALTDALLAGSGRVGATLAGTAVVLWSGLRVFRGIDVAFARIYGTTGTGGIVAEVRDGLVVMGSIGVGVTVVTVLGLFVRTLPLGPLADPVASLLVFAALIATFLPMYYVFPDQPAAFRSSFPGAIVAALGWVLLSVGFDIYVTVAGSVAVYGILGGIVLLVTFLYAGSLVLLTGATVNAVLAGDRQLQQDGPQASRRGE